MLNVGIKRARFYQKIIYVCHDKFRDFVPQCYANRAHERAACTSYSKGDSAKMERWPSNKNAVYCRDSLVNGTYQYPHTKSVLDINSTPSPS